MSPQQIDFSKILTDEEIFETIMSNYSDLGKEWILHQWNWINAVYGAFQDHDKYMIVISLVEKTLQFYHQMNIHYSYDEYYSKSFLQIEQFSIVELCEKLDLPKETVRRKVLELEEEGVINRNKKKIIIDRKAFTFVKPENQILLTSKYIYTVYKILNNNKKNLKKIDVRMIESVIKKRFTLCWRWFYKMQIPAIIGYRKNMFKDLATFHIWGTVCLNQAFNYSNKFKNQKSNLDYTNFNKILILNTLGNENGLTAMSIADMTGIPRATVIRKSNKLIKYDFLKLNHKKQYILHGYNYEKVLPYQKIIFKTKAKFIRKILNLLVI